VPESPNGNPTIVVRAQPGAVTIDYKNRLVAIPAANPVPISPIPVRIIMSIAMVKQIAGQVCLKEGQDEATAAQGEVPATDPPPKANISGPFGKGTRSGG
jgi:hypothetical protein